MKTKLSRAKALAACMSAFCVMTASWGLPGYVGNVSADTNGLQPEVQSDSHIVDATIFPDDEFRAYVSEKVDTDHDGYVTAEGDELSTREIKAALQDIIETEDRQKPYSDETLGKLLAEKGYPIARRTVAKYREQLGIPIARLRK